MVALHSQQDQRTAVRFGLGRKNMKDLSKLGPQLRKQRRTVDFDTYDVLLQQLLSMAAQGAIKIAPTYQRKFRWDDERCSQLIESLLLGIPIPSLFTATNRDETWDLVDGVQRLNTIVKFAGDKDLRELLGIDEPLRLSELTKLSEFNDFTFEELPKNLQLQFMLRPIKVVTLNDKSDRVVRFDLFERLNTGGVKLTPQEIRDCVYRGRFSKLLDKLAKNKNFRQVLRLKPGQSKDGTREECVLRFFAFLYGYQTFVHSVTGFLNDYMEGAEKTFDYTAGKAIFRLTFQQLAKAFPDGIRRRTRKTTPLNLFEGVAVGAALAIQQTGSIKSDGANDWIIDPELRSVTTGATNNPSAVRRRIEFCRDKFLGTDHV
jgi:hypothetical protein